MNSSLLDFVFAIIGVLLFRLKNPDKKLFNWISLFVLGLFASEFLYLYVGLPALCQSVWIGSSLGLISTYYLRFKSRPNKALLDYLKLICVILLVIYPWPFYSFVPIDQIFWVVRSAGLFFIAFVYTYDRWILKPEIMRKKYLVVLVAQSFLILLMLMYAFIQKAQADEAKEQSARLEQVAIEIEKKCQGQAR